MKIKRKKKTFKLPSNETAKKYGVTLPDSDASGEFLSPNEVGEILNLTGEAVKQWIYQRRLPAVKMSNGYWRVRKSDLEEFLADRVKAPVRPVLLMTTHADVVSEALSNKEYQLVFAISPADFVLKMESMKPALVVLDSTLNQMLARISRRIPTVLIGSKEPEESLLSAAIDHGVRAFLNVSLMSSGMIRDELQKVLNSH